MSKFDGRGSSEGDNKDARAEITQRDDSTLRCGCEGGKKTREKLLKKINNYVANNITQEKTPIMNF